MRNYTLRFWLAGMLFLSLSSIGLAQQAPVTTSVDGRLIRITPPLSQIDGSTMYGEPLIITRRGTGFAGRIVDPEYAEERIFRYLPNKDKAVSNTNTNSVISPNAPTSSVAINMDGQTATGFAPSDNNLAVGPNHVVQMINHSSGSIFKVWNKTGTVLKASTILSSITGVTGAGDPVVVYDQLADRWVLTEFGYSGGVTNYINTLIMAVSKTADPTGAYYVYSFNIGSFFVDYPKYAVWQNAYYATSNDFNTAGTSYLGSSAYAFERTAMIAGAPTARMVRTRFTGSGNRYYSMAPVCQEGPNVSNQSGLFALIHDNSWGGATVDSILLFEYTPNFAAGTAVSTFKGMASTLPFNTNTGNLSQLGTTTTIQALNQRLMHKVIYRNFGDHESIVCNATDLQNSRTGVHWWELRRPGSGNWSIFQEGLYQPAGDNHNRFMGSIAINANGTIGLLYNVTSSTIYPSMRFTGRSSCDPAGQMTLAETTVINSTTYNGTSRYGDYNTLSVDPANGSFWGTAQYNASGYGTYGNWVTRMVNFSLNGGCANAGTVSGTSPLCVDQTATYTTDGDAGGSWSSSNAAVATVNASSGLVTAVSAGTSNITYTVSGSSSFKTLTVNAVPTAGTISGPSSVCTGATITLTTNGTTGGTWSSDNTSAATVNASTGVVTGVADGSANISYSVTNSCGSATSAAYAVSVTTCANPTVSCPSNINASATGSCNASVTVPDPTTTNTTTLTWTMSGATTGSSAGTGINNVGTATFNIGVTTITYTASSGGPTATCSFTVTVSDNTAASITCPADISQNINGNRCSANINTPNPDISGNCSVTKLTWTLSGATSGSSASTGINYVGSRSFAVGITTVTYTLTNGANTTATCSYTVTLRNRKCPGSPAAPETDPGTINSTMVRNDGTLKVNVTPNPTETYFTLRLSSGTSEDLNISVYTVGGKLLQQFKGSAYQSYRFGNEYRSGVYIVIIRQGNKQTTLRLVK